MKARKRFGQHFLTDPGVLDRIVAALKLHSDDRLLEIGPGHGALTELLYPQVETFTAIEIDRDLIAMLRARFPRLRLVNADILQVDLEEVFGDERWRLVGNLPYNISSPLLLKLFDHLDLVRDMHFMFQRELAERLGAAPGSKSWGRLSVLAQYYCDIQPLFDVEPEAFTPPPQVRSQVIRMQPRRNRPDVDQTVFRLVLRTAFSARRKRLSNALKSFELDWDALPVTQDQRPDQLGVADYVEISRMVARSGTGLAADGQGAPAED